MEAVAALSARLLHIEDVLTGLGDTIAGLIKSALIALVILAVTIAASRLTSRRLRNGLTRGGFKLNVAILLARTLWFGVWAIGVLLILYVFGIGLTPLAAFIGVVGLAASLSLQQVLQNLVAGVYLLAEQPFAIQDTIAVVGPNGVNHEGRVEDVQMRTTHLRSRDDELILVPNAAIFGGVVTNRTAVGGFASHVTVTLPRTTDPATVRRQALPLLSSLPGVLPAPAPQLRVDKVGSDSWTATLSCWVQTADVVSDVIWRFADSFPDATINDVPATPA